MPPKHALLAIWLALALVWGQQGALVHAAWHAAGSEQAAGAGPAPVEAAEAKLCAFHAAFCNLLSGAQAGQATGAAAAALSVPVPPAPSAAPAVCLLAPRSRGPPAAA